MEVYSQYVSPAFRQKYENAGIIPVIFCLINGVYILHVNVHFETIIRILLIYQFHFNFLLLLSFSPLLKYDISPYTMHLSFMKTFVLWECIMNISGKFLHDARYCNSGGKCQHIFNDSKILELKWQYSRNMLIVWD